jgi:hypothetical protein
LPSTVFATPRFAVPSSLPALWPIPIANRRPLHFPAAQRRPRQCKAPPALPAPPCSHRAPTRHVRPSPASVPHRARCCPSRHTSFYPRSAFVPLFFPAYFVLSPARPRPAAPPRLLLVLPLAWASPCSGLRSPGPSPSPVARPGAGKGQAQCGQRGAKEDVGLH